MTDTQDQGSSLDGEGTFTNALAEVNHFDLDYPQIPLDLSLESLLAHSHPSTPSSQIMPASEATSSSLGDSWASLTDVESTNEDDLRSEHTDVGSLLDVHSSDDVQSVREDLDPSEGESTDEEDAGDTSTVDLGCTSVLRSSAQRDAVVDLQHVHATQTSQDEKNIQATGQSPVYLHTTTRPLTQDEAHKVSHRLGAARRSAGYISVMNMTLLEDGLDVNTFDYFKVVLLGKHVEQFRPEIQRKLGDALVSRRVTSDARRTSTSRFHLVPNSFGPGAEPDFADLVAIDKQIDFDCYDTVEEREVVSKWNGHTHLVANSRWTPPDLAVVCVHLDEKQRMDEESHALLKFVARHGIASIVVRMDRHWFGEYSDSIWKADSLYEDIEAANSYRTRNFTKLPVDLAAFLNLDAAALNKHIAFITSNNAEALTKKPVANVSILDKVHEKLPHDLRLVFLRNFALIKNMLFVLWIIGVYIFLGAHLWPVVYDTLSSTPSHTDKVAAADPGGQPQTWTSEIQSTLSSVSPETTVRALQVGQQNLAVASVSVMPSKAEDAIHFQVGVAGDHQLVVRLPKVATNRKKQSPLTVGLKRNNRPISVAVHELFAGVYSIELQPRDAWGDVQVHLSMSDPDLSESLTVSFGDRSFIGHLQLKGTIDMFEKQFYDTMAALSKQPETLVQGIAQNMRSIEEEIKVIVDANISPLKAHVGRRIHALQAGIYELAEAGTVRSKEALKQFPNRVLHAHLAVCDLFAALDTAALKPQLDKTMVVEKLATAQERAQQIVANAKGQLRSTHGRQG
ncbi:hypothetical protein LTR67_000442 [Exophiala xenobiotica]